MGTLEKDIAELEAERSWAKKVKTRRRASSAQKPVPGIPGFRVFQGGFLLDVGIHAKNKTAGRMILILVLGLWGKNTVICAGAKPYRWNFPAAARA